MGIFSRLADIINSNLSAILDSAEDPEKLIRLMIQEMEETLVEVRSSAARAIADKKELQRKLTRIREAQTEWQRKAELALSREREDLARGALIEKARLTDSAAALEEELGYLDERLVKFQDDVTKLEAKLTEVRARQKAIQARQQTATSQLRVRRQLHDSRVEDALARFEHMQRRIDATEGEVEAFELGRGRRTLTEEIADLEKASSVDAELQALKTHLKGQRS